MYIPATVGPTSSPTGGQGKGDRDGAQDSDVLPLAVVVGVGGALLAVIVVVIAVVIVLVVCWQRRKAHKEGTCIITVMLFKDNMI